MIQIKKRNGQIDKFTSYNIYSAIEKAYKSVNKQPVKRKVEEIVDNIKKTAEEYNAQNRYLGVEEIQDMVEIGLIDLGEHVVLKSFILYRNKHAHLRHMLQEFEKLIDDQQVLTLLKEIQADYPADVYSIQKLYYRIKSFHKEGMTRSELIKVFINAAVELTSKEAPDWEYIAARFLNLKIEDELKVNRAEQSEKSFYDRIIYYAEKGLYGKYMCQYTREEVDQLEAYIDNNRNKLLTYSSLNLLAKRYMLANFDKGIIESPQEMFMGIAMHLMINEKDRVKWVKQVYDVISNLKATFATPTMSNSRRPHHQLSSCFIDVVDDSLTGIYKSLDNFAQVSKSGGGMGMYFGKVRASGSDIRGYKGVAGGVIRWIRLANDTAVAVDQLGVRQGAVAVYLDAWHRDLPEFLQLKTNNGDDRAKAHDVFPGICYPDLFWRLAKENINAEWHLMCPHEVYNLKGYHLEDYYGEEWEEKYYDCVNDPRLHKRRMSVKDIVRMIIKSATETGTPFTFNRDVINKTNPNKHAGMIYSSNLCTEIMQNMSAISNITRETVIVDGEEIVVEKSTPGDFVVCNLSSLVLGNIDVEDKADLENTVSTMVRALDNVIDLNYYPIEYARITNHKYRAIGLGVSGYHHLLVNHSIDWETDEHIAFADKVFEDINYYAIKASNQIAKEKGSYAFFEGSDWQNGDYFKLRDYTSARWQELTAEVNQNGLRNGYLMAVAPTGSTSIIAGTTAGTDPVMNVYFLEEKKGDIVPRVAPNLNVETFWLYKSAHNIDQSWSIKACAVRQRHVDQAQSFNLYITTEHSMRQILNYYIEAWEAGVKTLYYIRSRSLEVEECESCFA